MHVEVTQVLRRDPGVTDHEHILRIIFLRGLRGGRKGLDLLGFGQNAGQAHDQQVTNQVRMSILGPTANIVLLEAADSFGDSRSISPAV